MVLFLFAIAKQEVLYERDLFLLTQGTEAAVLAREGRNFVLGGNLVGSSEMNSVSLRPMKRDGCIAGGWSELRGEVRRLGEGRLGYIDAHRDRHRHPNQFQASVAAPYCFFLML